MKASIVIPAKNEAVPLSGLLPDLRRLYPDFEIVVVNDGSTDNTREVCRSHGVVIIEHPYSKGNGAAIKSGARAATGDILIFMDADGQHNPADIASLLEQIDQGFDMVVGARSSSSQASSGRAVANGIYNWLSSKMAGHVVEDLTSGFRAVIASKFAEFISILPNGFSYPTTSTMAFFRAGYSVAYVPIVAAKRVGKSHINIVRDGVRFFLIIFKIATLYSPLKMFLPISAFFFVTGVFYYTYTYMTDGRFTNMGVLLFVTSVLIFLMGLVSEQITVLMYKEK